MKDSGQREARRLSLQESLDAAKTQAERNRLGQFATPPALAKAIVDAALVELPHRCKVRFLDPGFGTGSFYSALVGSLPKSRLQVATGFEIDHHYGNAARELWDDTGLKLHLEDFTRALAPARDKDKFNLVVCNPPYVRHHHLSLENKRHLQYTVAAQTNLTMTGLSGLYCYFLAISKAWMAEGGIGAWLIPSEFMDVNYGSAVKRFLAEQVTLLQIHRFDPKSSQFADALVSSAVLLFRNSLPPENHSAIFSFGGSVRSPDIKESVPTIDVTPVRKWTSLPRITERPEAMGGDDIRLADLFSIKRGLATGCNSFFVLRPEQVIALKLPSGFLKPILPSPRYLDVDQVLADASGMPLIGERRLLLDCRLPPAEVRRHWPQLWKYLEEGVEAGIDRRYLCRHRDPWYSQEDRPPPPFLCTYMGRQGVGREVPFRFILNHSQATAANVYLLLYPKPWLANLLQAHPKLQRVLWQQLGSIAAHMLTSEGRLYGGGLHKLEPKELANVSAKSIVEAMPRNVQPITQKLLFA